jgi:CheY-like chemotaxis protein
VVLQNTNEFRSSTCTASPLTGALVLVAEDNLVNLEVARFHLEDLGCVPTAALNGAEALDLAKAKAFDFILLDCQMPVMDGFAALQAIRAIGPESGNERTPIIAVTAADDLQSQLLCARVGFDGFLAKPFSAEQLRAVLLGYGSIPVSIVPSKKTRTDTELPLIEHAAFAAFVEDFGVETAASLLSSFVKSLDESVGRFDQCVAAIDFVGLQALGHKIAGAAGTVGAQRLAALARRVDADGKSGHLKLTHEVLQLRKFVEDTREILLPLEDCAMLKCFVASMTVNDAG